MKLFPDKLSQTGLFAEITERILDAGVESYAPRFELWSDGASKLRWIALPAGQKIDSQDWNMWSFPKGTKLWKEFRVGSKLVETRLLQKFSHSDKSWGGVSYIWNNAGTEAYKAVWGGVDVNGTELNVPAAAECMGCHGGRKNRVLGFSAIQLSASGSPGDIDLADIATRGWLSNIKDLGKTLPGTPTELAALGYLHANCSHCHNADRPNDDDFRCFDPQRDFSFLLTAEDSIEKTETYRTALGRVLKKGNSARNIAIRKMKSRNRYYGMPPIGTEHIDENGIAIVREWIDGL
ncbi:MAG: hypothetical protein ACOH5I_22735 [Oligoflexus sp.]